MSHKGVRSLIEDVAKSLADDMQFTYARTSDFNVLRDKRYPFISLDPLTAVPIYTVNNASNYVKRWSAQMAFYQLDSTDSDQTQYAKILDEMDDLVDQFINRLNLYAFDREEPSEIVLTSITQNPFVKVTADILTGYLVTFTIETPDDFNYCGLDC